MTNTEEHAHNVNTTKMFFFLCFLVVLYFFVVKLLFSFLICFPLEFGARELATPDWYIFSREYQTKQNEKNRNNGPQANVLWGRRVFGCSAYVSVCVWSCVLAAAAAAVRVAR